jgi:hypothetical protein
MDSVVLGHGVGNSFLHDLPCADDSLCVGGSYVWVLRARRTVVGPPIVGTVRALGMQHGDATTQLVKAAELFVLRPIDDPRVRESSGAQYYLVALSPRYPDGSYCLSVKPKDVGLELAPADIEAQPGRPYCFKASLLDRARPDARPSEQLIPGAGSEGHP